MGAPCKHTLKELALEQISIETDQGDVNVCSKLEDEELGAERTFYGKGVSYWLLMLGSSTALIIGLSSASLLGRYYYVHGGSRRWVYTWIESAGWPVLVIPLLVCYWKRGEASPTLNVLTPKLCIIYIGLGALTAFDNLLYSLGYSYLPVSTNSLVCSSQLVFNAMFAYVLVGQKMSACIINAIVIISIGTILLGVGSGSDKPPSISEREYIMGFVVTVAASALYALLLPLLQLLYSSKYMRATRNTSIPLHAHHSPDHMQVDSVYVTKVSQHQSCTSTVLSSSDKPSFLIVLEVQIAISAVASAFAFLGMYINADLAALRAEAVRFDAGVCAYIMTLFWSAIGWQLCFLGSSGIIFLSSSLMSCICTTAMIPIIPILAVFMFHDSFSALKAIAMVLSMWGFMSYIYDGYIEHKSKKNGIS